jgi:hypothetical protein
MTPSAVLGDAQPSPDTGQLRAAVHLDRCVITVSEVVMHELVEGRRSEIEAVPQTRGASARRVRLRRWKHIHGVK